MRSHLECFPCLLRQALDAARASVEDEATRRRILNEVMLLLAQAPPAASPPWIARDVHRRVRELSGNEDPYREAKHRSNDAALALVPALRERLSRAGDELELAVRLAVAGNVIDFALGSRDHDLAEEIEAVVRAPFGAWDYARFRERVARAGTILYLGDNAGEIVLDTLLVEVLGRVSAAEIVFVVRDRPVLNDATMEDARRAGLDRLVRVIGNGSDAPATLLPEVSEEVRRLFVEADVVISKGQGNYEALGEEASEKVFFLLKVKCPVMARITGVEEGRYVLAAGGG